MIQKSPTWLFPVIFSRSLQTSMFLHSRLFSALFSASALRFQLTRDVAFRKRFTSAMSFELRFFKDSYAIPEVKRRRSCCEYRSLFRKVRGRNQSYKIYRSDVNKIRFNRDVRSRIIFYLTRNTFY